MNILSRVLYGWQWRPPASYQGLKSVWLSCALWLMRCWAEVSATTRFPDERSTGWARLFIAQPRDLIAERESRAWMWGPHRCTAGLSRGQSWTWCVLWLPPELDSIDFNIGSEARKAPVLILALCLLPKRPWARKPWFLYTQNGANNVAPSGLSGFSKAMVWGLL